jgi:hypothetical protein
MLRHIFIFDPEYVHKIGGKSLSEETPSPQITASDVDSSVNNCALICALLISIPAGVISDMGSPDFYTNMMSSGSWGKETNCSSAHLADSTFSQQCLVDFRSTYWFLVSFVLASFYTNIFSLLMAVLYYMCRPSESYNISSSITLLEAFTQEVRQRIRRERSSAAESEKAPSVPFDDPILESEVFFKASFLAQNESEEQKNQEFYMWYKSELFKEETILLVIDAAELLIAFRSSCLNHEQKAAYCSYSF